MQTIKIDAATTADALHEDLGQNYGACNDLIALGASEHGEHRIEMARDGSGAQRIDVIYFADAGRAAIDDNGGTHWTDASSIKDAIRRYRRDDLQN